MMITEHAKVHGDELARDGRRLEPGVPAESAAQRLGGLVLARQLGESIMIGDAVLVEVLGLKSNAVRLRVVAPRSIPVHRREVYDAIRLAPGAAEVQPTGDDVLATLTETTALPSDGGLVLTRRVGQTIMIGDAVAIDIVEARPGTARLRVIAPRSVRVHRREVYEAIQTGTARVETSVSHTRLN